MQTIVTFSSKSIKIMQGSYSRKKFSISNYYSENTPEGAVLNGRIMDKEAMQNALIKIKDSFVKFRECEVVIDSGRVMHKVMPLPMAKPAGMEQMAKNMLIERLVFGDEYITDYTVLEKDFPQKKQCLVLSCAVDKEIVEEYVSLFEAADIRLARMDTALTGILKLTYMFPNFSKEKSIICVVDNYSVNVINFTSSGNLFTSRARVDEPEGSENYYSEIINRIYEYVNFKRHEDRAHVSMAEQNDNTSQNYVIYIFDANTYTVNGYLKAIEQIGANSDFKIIGLDKAFSDDKVMPNGMDPFINLLGMLI